ncbi:MAG: flagellar hook-associated protein FlgL [Magnetococcales bacterium]|nr:flagellar hook-associated protein FlgL [Magnetococcales bacterium]
MRVTQAVLYRNVASSLQAQYQELSKIQEQSTSGNRLTTPSDDPTAYYRHILFSSDLSNVDTLKKTTGMASDRFTMAEQSIQTIHDKFQDAQDLIIQMGSSNNAGIPQVMKATGQQIHAMYQDVMSYANTEMDGVPLFGGGKTRVPFNANVVETTGVKLRSGGQGGFTDVAGTDFAAQLTGTPAAVPMSVKVTYKTTDAKGVALATPVYSVNVDGADSPDIPATGAGQKINVAAGVTLSVNTANPPKGGDAFYFEVVPAYQGGEKDRQVKVSDTNAIDGNVTGAQLINGRSSLGRGVNLLATLTALRGAFMRADISEVNSLLGRTQEARAQASDMQAVTGIRGAQVQAINATLTDDSNSLTEAKAKNTSVDAFDVMSRLSQTTQALQVTLSTEQQVLNTSLLNFLK